MGDLKFEGEGAVWSETNNGNSTYEVLKERWDHFVAQEMGFGKNGKGDNTKNILP